jgi:hypothetical protein
MRTWRTINIFKDKAFSGDSGKETFALPRTHMIGDLWLVVRAKNTTAGNQATSTAWQSIELNMDKIAIKSGSKTFKSYDGEMCRLIAAHMDGRNPPELRDMDDDIEQESVFPIHFGLEPQDEDVILPAPLLDSLDMVLEYSFPTATTVGFVTAAKEFDLYANVLEPTADLEDKMVLVQEKKQDFTAAASGSTPFDLTLDERRLLRKVYVQAYVKDEVEGTVVSNLKIKADNEEVIDTKWRMLQHQNAVDNHLNFRQDIHFVALSKTDDYLSKIPDVKPSLGMALNVTGLHFIDAIAGDNVGITSAAVNDATWLSCYSDVLPTVAVLDFDRDKSLRRLQPQGIRDLDLIVEDAKAGACAIYEESLQKIW